MVDKNIIRADSSRMMNMSIKAMGIGLILLMVVVSSVSVFVELMVERETIAVSNAWTTFEIRDASKMRIVGQLRTTLDYGGMIHQLKNHTLRDGDQLLASAWPDIREAGVLLDQYRALGVSEREDNALNDLVRMIGLYENVFEEADILEMAGASPDEIDGLIRIDDETALIALNILDTENRSAHDAGAQRVYQAIVDAGEVVIVSKIVMAGLYAVMILLFIWHLIFRVTRPLFRLGNAMGRLAEGYLEIHIPELGRNDEIGDMAKSVEVFRETAKSQLWAEEALRSGEARLHLFVEHTPVAIAMFDAKMHYIMCSRLWLEENDLTDTEIIGHSHYELLPDTPDQRKDIFRHVLDGVSRVSEEDLVHQADGDAAWTRWIVEPWLKRDGEIGGIIVISEDVTDRKQAEGALRESEGRLASALQIAKLGHWEWNSSSGQIRMSREIALMIGEGDEDIDISCDDYIKRVHPYDRDDYIQVLRAFRKDHAPYEVDYRIISRLGEIRGLLEKGEFRPGEDGKPDRAFGMIQDITDLTRAQEAARESEAQLRLIMENVADGVITIDQKGIIESFFGAAESIFDYTAEEVIGENISMLMPDPHHGQHDDYLAAYMKGQGVSLVGGTGREVNARRKNGELIPIELVITELYQNGQRKFVGTVRDISEKKLIEQRLRDSKRIEAIGELAGGIAHDFNNILMVIDGFAKRAMANMDNPDRLRHSLSEVIKSADKGATLTHQLLMFGRRELLESRIFRVKDQINDFTPVLQTLVGESITLNVEIEDGKVCILTDPNELYQAIVNLAANGRDAMPDGGTLTIRVESLEFDAMRAMITPNASAGPYVRISVTDSGCGMDDDTLMRVFEPFFTTKEQGKGTGLGLALVYGFIKQSNGVIEADSTPGKGTTFSMYFPVADGAPKVEIKRRISTPSTNSETILLAEDDDALRMLAQETLEDHGYHVLTARDGIEALEADDDYDNTIHMLVTDVVMPGLSGFDVAEVLRQSCPDMKVVFMSGYPVRGQIKSVEIPLDAPFLQKPFPPEKLLDMVRETLGSTTTAGDHAALSAAGD